MILLILTLAIIIFPAECFSELENVPFPARLIIYKAQKLMDEKKYTEAIEVLKRFKKKSEKLKPSEADKKGYTNYLIDFTLGNCFFMIGRYREAKKYYLASVKKKSDFSTGWLNLAQCCYELKEYLSAADAFLKTYKTSQKKKPDYLYFAAVSFLSAGKPSKALTVLNRLLRMNIPLKTEWKEAIAHSYISCNRLKEALPFVEELSERTKGEKRRQWQQVRLHIYLSLNMDKKALSYLKRLLQEDPVQPKWWKGLAYLYLKKNHYKDALSALIIKGFLEPLTDQEKRTAAQLSMAIGIPKVALDFYKSISKNNPSIMYHIAICYLRLHRPEDSLWYVNKALKKDPKQKKLLLLKGELLYQLKRYREAASVFEKAAESKVDPGRCYLMAGYSFWNVKDFKKAYLAFKQAAKYPLFRSSALRALKLIRSATALKR